MWHTLLAFLAGLMPALPDHACADHRVLIAEGGRAGAIILVSDREYVPCSLAGYGRFAGLELDRRRLPILPG